MLEMLLHVLLWLFVITTDRISSLSQPDCGGEVSLDQGPVGHVLLPGPSLSSRGSVWSCSWVIEIPEDRTLLLELTQSPGGAGVSVLCGDVTGAHRHVLGGQGGALLKGCGGNQAHITWTGDGRSPDEIQLSYQVQEDERTSWSESDRTGPPSAQTLTHWTQTRTSFTGALPVGSEVMTRTEEVRGHLRGGEDWSPGSAQDREPTSPLTGLWVAGRGTPPFPEEGPNNGAETSGTVHSTERPVSVTHPSFEHTLHTDVFTTETDSGPEHRQNQNQNQVYSSGLQEDPTPSTSNSPPSALYSTRGGATVPPISHDEDVSATPKPSQSHSWRIHRSTKRLGSDPVTSDPSRSPFVAVSRDSDGVHAGSPTPESYTPTPTAAFRSPARPVAPEWTAPNPSPADSGTASQSERGAEIHSRTAATQRTERLGHTPHPVSTFTRPQTTAENTRLPGTDQLTDGTLTGSAPTPGDGPASPAVESTRTETQTLPPSCTLLHEQTHQTSAGPPSLPSIPDSGPWYRQTTHPVMPSSTLSQSTLSQSTLSQSTLSQSTLSQSTLSDQETVPASPPAPAVSPSQTALLPSTTAGLVLRVSPGLSLADHVPWSSVPGLTTTYSSTAAPSLQPPHRTTEGSGQETKSRPTSSAETSTSAATQRSTTSQTPRFYVVPDQPAVIKVESIELLLQITVEGSAFNSGREEDATAWVEVFLKNTPGFSRVLGVWSSGRAVQVLVEFQTSGALRWLETTGLAEAAGQGQEFGSSQVVNITLGGVQGPVCDWLLQCPSGYKCLAQTEAANYTCSSVCRFDYCHHHGLCTHHPGGRPVCRCLVGEDFWYIGLRCDMRMTRTRLVGACLAILVVIVTVIGVLAFVAVRRYRAVLIQAKVDQTRSSYRRFNHFDELSGRFWLRSVAGSADSVDNPVFTRSDELLHLRALDRPCCYHDDTLSLASTCPSHGTRINTVYPHGSQYGWRGSELSVGEGVLDSGKASDLSVCSWPVEPIHWTPFPILQQLSSHGAATVRVSRPRSYCEGMELVEIGKSWTA